jgi:hypothetical protein
MAAKKDGQDVKVDANVFKPIIDILIAVGNCFGNLQKYQHKEKSQDSHTQFLCKTQVLVVRMT